MAQLLCVCLASAYGLHWSLLSNSCSGHVCGHWNQLSCPWTPRMSKIRSLLFLADIVLITFMVTQVRQTLKHDEIFRQDLLSNVLNLLTPPPAVHNHPSTKAKSACSVLYGIPWWRPSIYQGVLRLQPFSFRS